MPDIPAFGRLRQEDLKFKASLSYIVRPCLKQREKKKKKKNSWKLTFTISIGSEALPSYS
jgi:hypothetical protein